MVQAICPKCGESIFITLKKEDNEKSIAEIVNEVMEEIALEQGIVGSYI